MRGKESKSEEAIRRRRPPTRFDLHIAVESRGITVCRGLKLFCPDSKCSTSGKEDVFKGISSRDDTFQDSIKFKGQNLCDRLRPLFPDANELLLMFL